MHFQHGARPFQKISVLLLTLLVSGSIVSCGQDTAHDKAGALFDAMAIEEGSWAADVGSGDGDYTGPMAKRVGASGRVFAVDVDSEKLEELNERLQESDIEHVTSVYSVEDNPMLPPNAFDAVLVRNTYHHFSAPESMLRHIKAALKSDGRLVIEESVSDDMTGASREEQVEDHDIGLEYVREELKAAGFTIQRADDAFVEKDGHFHWLIVATPPAS